MATVKQIQDNAFSGNVTGIAAGGGTATIDFALPSTSDGGMIDVVVAGKTACPTT